MVVVVAVVLIVVIQKQIKRLHIQYLQEQKQLIVKIKIQMTKIITTKIMTIVMIHLVVQIVKIYKQILIMQAVAEQKGTVCDTDTLNAEFERYFGTTDSSSYVEVYGENYLKMNVLHDLVMQGLIEQSNA